MALIPLWCRQKRFALYLQSLELLTSIQTLFFYITETLDIEKTERICYGCKYVTLHLSSAECYTCTLFPGGGGALVFKSRYHAQVKKHGKRVVFTERHVPRGRCLGCQKQQKSRKRVCFLRLNKKYVLRVYFLLTIRYMFRVVLVCRPLHCSHKMTLKLAKTSYFVAFCSHFVRCSDFGTSHCTGHWLFIEWCRGVQYFERQIKLIIIPL